MLIDTQEYLEHLSKEAPDYNFVSLEKINDYKDNSEIYEVSFTKEVEEKVKEYSYRMLVGYMSFEKEKQMENFVEVARLTFHGKNKEDKEEAEKAEKEKENK